METLEKLREIAMQCEDPFLLVTKRTEKAWHVNARGNEEEIAKMFLSLMHNPFFRNIMEGVLKFVSEEDEVMYAKEDDKFNHLES